MKKFLLMMAAVVFTVGLGLSEAEAKRLGGGKSFGMQRGDNVMRRDASPSAPSQAVPGRPATAPAAAPAGNRSRWLGPIAGLAAGLGLAALASHLGLGEEFGTFLMVLLLIVGAVFLFRMLRRPKADPGALQYAGNAPAGGARNLPPLMPAGGSGAAAGPVSGAATLPAGFDSEGFLRVAKVNFLRMQAANDAGNIEDIRDFTTPEMFAELRLDLQDRKGARQQTDVVTLNAELLDVSEESDKYIASVRFNGNIRETEGAAPEAFDEVWHLSKPRQGGGWVVAGIQQYV